MPLPPGQLSFGQIRDLALRRVGLGAAGQGSQVFADASAYLAQMLYELYVGWEWPWLYTSTTITIVGPTFALPPDFLDTQDDRAFFVNTWDGADAGGSAILQRDPYTFNTVAAGNVAQGRPRLWMADQLAQVGRVFPDPTAHVAVCTLRYKQLPLAEVAAPVTPTANDAIIPRFPYHLLLVQQLFVELCKWENDPRQDAQEAAWAREFQRIRQTSIPLRADVNAIPLDNSIFGPVFTGDGGGEDV